MRLPPLLPHRMGGFEESSSEKYRNNFNKSGMAGTTMVPKCTSDEHSQFSLNPSGKQSTNRTRFSTTPSDRKQNAATSGLGSFREKLAEGLSEKRSVLSHMQEGQV